MKVARTEEMRAVEGMSFEHGISAEILMETAGRAIARAARELSPRAGARFLVLVGPGQNGGDGLTAARHLLSAGAHVTVWLLVEPGKLRGEARTQYDRLHPSGRVAWVAADEEPSGHFDAAVDAIFGTALRGEVTGRPRAAIAYLAEHGVPAVAADLPSGVRGDDGQIAGVAVHATCTVALGALKPGHLFLPGRDCCGRVTLEPLGLLPEWLEELPLVHVTELGPAAGPGIEAPKQAYGRVVIVAGCAQYPGAPWLSARGSARAGAGLTVLASVGSVLQRGGNLPEVIVRELQADSRGRIAPEHLRPEQWADAQAVVLGPGLGRIDEENAAQWRRVISGLRRPLVLDADGLRIYRGQPELLRARPAPTVLTPHCGEAGLLLGHEVREAAPERLAAAQELARRSGAVALLKGQPTFIAAPWGRVGIVDEGGPELATGGTGDVLSGLIGAQLAQGYSARRAAERGALAHARAGARLRQRAPRGILASEVADELPLALAATCETGALVAR